MSTITLSQKSAERLRELVDQTGRTPQELVDEAIDTLSTRLSLARRREALAHGKGLWKDRDDLPDFRALRREMDERFRRP
jgi:hypothetical protein